MTPQDAKRKRRSPKEARRHVIACAERLLAEGGPAAVQMRAVARKAEMTDAGVAHHFGNRDGLLKALLDHGAEKVRGGVEAVVRDWLARGPDLRRLAALLGRLYANGYAALALELHRSGWRENGAPLLEPVVQCLLALNRRPETPERRIRGALALLHADLALDPLFGEAFRRSAGLKDDLDRAAQLDWWVDAMAAMLGLPDPATPARASH